MPVKVEAALTLGEMCAASDIAKDLLKPDLEKLLKSYLTLLNEIDSEELINILSTFTSVFRDEIGPYAVTIVKELAM